MDTMATGTRESVLENAEVRRRLTAESESLLDQAAAFARGGDYLGAEARARFAGRRLTLRSASLPAGDAFLIATHAHLELRIHHYASLARDWQTEVENRRAAYLVRERRAIGPGMQAATGAPSGGRRTGGAPGGETGLK